jgi:hypothetical protein
MYVQAYQLLRLILELSVFQEICRIELRAEIDVSLCRNFTTH